MRALLQQIAIGIRLDLRNRMALAYSFLFPAIFLLAFRLLYRSERVPLLLHAGGIVAGQRLLARAAWLPRVAGSGVAVFGAALLLRAVAA